MSAIRKKYRKIRVKFDEIMRESNALFVEEQKADQTAKRLAQENDRLLDLLLDINNSAQIPVDKRIDLKTKSPHLAAVPPLVSEEDLAEAAELTTPEGQAVYKEIQGLLKEKEYRAGAPPSKSLAQLMAVPHIPLDDTRISKDLLASLEPPKGKTTPISYLSVDQMDEFLHEIDATLGYAPALGTLVYPITPQEVATKNPYSALNWLRTYEARMTHVPDGEAGQYPSNAKPNHPRAPGKRAVVPTPNSRPESLEIVEEVGTAYDASSAMKGKRKRDGNDDGGYTPKSGNPVNKSKRSRPSTKRKSETLGETTASGGSRRSRPKPRNSSPTPSGPAPHPFGPIG
ncbi:IEC3 subunit of the ino80 complex chromatin re-modelling domain-containing protein [Rutstroemia sp. NJR-2017a BBW]|nr:IEC3 subunit of the ino80 complex chromatin re-modelling domain-containing protein [Rutstroemia sp. NJR-2017a BBW]